MYFNSDESREKYIENLVKDLRAAADLYPALCQVLQQYDKKVFNCRFEKALKEKTGARIYAEKRYKHLEITVYTNNHNTCYTLATMPLDAMPDGKRIDAQTLIENARERRTALLKKAAAIEDQAPRADAIKSQILQLQRALNAITSPLEWEVRDVYGLNYRLSNY